MKMLKSLLLLTNIALVLAFGVPLKAQDTQQDYLDAHNIARATEGKGVGPLLWSETLASYARAYATQTIDCSPILSGGPYGEIIWSGLDDLSADQFVALGMRQKSDYSYDTNTCSVGKECAFYLQIVWSKTVFLGCAKTKCVNDLTLTICNYDPIGNFASERPY
ncbi:unnamed protein product [Cochlearia groenlandica]